MKATKRNSGNYLYSRYLSGMILTAALLLGGCRMEHKPLPAATANTVSPRSVARQRPQPSTDYTRSAPSRQKRNLLLWLFPDLQTIAN